MKPEQLAALRAAAESLPTGYDYVLEKDEILALLDHIAKLEAGRDAVIEQCAQMAETCGAKSVAVHIRAMKEA